MHLKINYYPWDFLVFVKLTLYANIAKIIRNTKNDISVLTIKGN